MARFHKIKILWKIIIVWQDCTNQMIHYCHSHRHHCSYSFHGNCHHGDSQESGCDAVGDNHAHQTCQTGFELWCWKLLVCLLLVLISCSIISYWFWHTDHPLRLLLLCLYQQAHQVTDHIAVFVIEERGGQPQIAYSSSPANTINVLLWVGHSWWHVSHWEYQDPCSNLWNTLIEHSSQLVGNNYNNILIWTKFNVFKLRMSLNTPYFFFQQI